MRSNRAKGHVGIVAIALCSLISAGQNAARAQTVGSGVIEGRVTDETRQVLPGATVTATSPALQVREVVQVTDGEGAYRFVDLPAGLYKVTFSLTGFRSFVRDELRLNVGFVSRIDAQLTIGVVEEAVTVTGRSPVVDAVTTVGSTNLTKEILESVPTTRTMWQALGMAPGVRSTSLDIGGKQLAIQQGYKTYGTNGQNNPMIEGILTRQADNSAGMFYDYSTFEEIQVKTVGMDADTPLPGASFLGIVKSGGNEFHGTYFAGGSTEKFVSDNIDDELRAQNVTSGDPLLYFRDVSGDLGGRIVRDKLWFYGALRRQKAASRRTGYAQAPGPDGVYLTADDVPGDSVLGLPNETLKVSYQPRKATKLIAFYQNSGKLENARMGARFRPFEATQNGTSWLRAWKGELQSTPTNWLLFSILGGRQNYLSTYPAQDGIDVAGNPSRSNRETGLFTGPPAQQDVRPRSRYQSSGTVSFFPAGSFGGRHSIKTGYQVYLERVGTGFANKPSGNYLLTFDRVGGVSNQPAEIATYNYPILETSNRETTYALYTSDSWRITNRVTANLGLRWEQYHVFVEEQTKAQGQFGTSGTFPAVEVVTRRAVAPRLGFAFDLFGDARTVLKATYGRYNHAFTEDFAQDYNPNALVTTTYRWRDQDGNRDYTPGEVNLDVNGPDFISITGASNNVLNPNLRQPFTHEVSASIERQLASNLSVRGLYVYKRQVDQFESVNILRPYSAWNIPISRRDPGPDGVLNTADDGSRVSFFDYSPDFRGSRFVGNQPTSYMDGRVDYYQTLEATIDKRLFRNWSLMASAAATRNHRWLVGTSASPNDDFFPLDETWDWQFKLVGTYQLSRGILVSAFLQSLAGVPGQRTYVFRSADPDGGTPLAQASTVTLRLEPFGTESTPAQHVLNLRGAKSFKLGASRRLDFSVDLFNALNVNVPTTRTYVSGPSFGAITAIMSPRVLRLVTTFAF